MNRKQFGILLVLVVVVGSAGLLLRRNQLKSWTGQSAVVGGKLLGNFSVNDVAEISMIHDTNTLNLVKKGDLWRVAQRNDYPADFSRISELLLKVRDLKAVQVEPIGPSQLARLQLAPPGQGTNSALAVEFKGQNGAVVKTLFLGKPHLKKSSRPSPSGDDEDWPDGRFVKVGDSDTVAVVSDPLESIESKPDGWLNKDFIHIEKIRTIAIDFPRATNSWKLTRNSESADWNLADAKAGEKLDSAKATEVSNPLASLSFADVLPAETIGGAGATMIHVSTFDDFNYQITVGVRTNDDYPIQATVTAKIPKERSAAKDEKPEDKIRLDKAFQDRQQKLGEKLLREQDYGKWIYLVAGWALDPLLKERAQLLAVNSPESKGAGKNPQEPDGGPDSGRIISPLPGGSEK